MNACNFAGTKEDWNHFVTKSSGSSFLQSWEWGELQRVLGVPFWRLAVEDNGQLQAVALLIQRELPGGYCWMYIPHGPAVRSGAKCEALELLLEEVQKVARDRGAVFARLEPKISPNDLWAGSVASETLRHIDAKKADHNVQPRHTIIVDLKQSEEGLLNGMHPKTRYNIRLAQKKGVVTRFSKDEADLESFLKLCKHVSQRSSFRYHPEEYYRQMLAVLGSAGILEIGVAEQKKHQLAVHLLFRFGNTTTYAHGASSSRSRELMGPHLLQWESIRRAKQMGSSGYDFFGVAPADAGKDHPWAGITRFKEGFGGERVDYVGACDIVLQSMWYWLYNTARRTKQSLR